MICAAAVCALMAANSLQARTWTSADGSRSFEGELQEYDPASGMMTVMINGKIGSFNHAILSVADIVYLENLGEFKREKKRPESLAVASEPAAGAAEASMKPVSATTNPSRSFSVPEKAVQLIDYYCIDCHEDGTEKGGLRFDNLESHSLEGWVDILNQMQEQIYFKQMPPKDEDQFNAEERSQMLAWLSQELDSLNASKLDEKLRFPSYGNAVNHEKLFSGEIKAAAYTPGRRWLVSPQIFEQRVIEIFEPELLGRGGVSFYGITNPFLLPDASGVRYYDNGVLDGGHLLVMLSNAEWISKKLIRAAQVKNGEFEANHFPDPKDKWSPAGTPEAFEAIILKEGEPTEEQMEAAISKQFQLVLQREPESWEIVKYLDLLRSSIGIGGNTQGLRQMLVAVLLESEFLYRLEFGDGSPDAHGRKMLSPREGAYAISYALGDRSPDDKLLEAAANGDLESKEDYQREVTRLLADEKYYQGPTDPAFTTSKVKSHVTSHPRINRFFRDFFGYPMAIKVFKDSERSDGYYANPGRGTLATPGFLVDEADRFLDWHLQKDQNVFENLLTSNEYFVYHDRSDEDGTKIITEWREVYEELKGTRWKTDPEGVLKKHIDFISARGSMRSVTEKKPGELVNFMHFFDEHFGQGRTPFTTVPWAHGYYFHHSPFYGLPPTPSTGRYGSWKSTKFNDNLEEIEHWDYPVKQPFKVENRKGILTHPAWLIAHSKNTHNDPVVRGKWVREKLLAGRVPDVPITVDAQIPEDHDRTLRARLHEKTRAPECWKCHDAMNPLGLPFEIYDDFGRYRTEEALEAPENVIGKNGRYNIYKTLKIDASGVLTGTGDPNLDGAVDNALELIDRIAKSAQARQSIIRHAFRFYMGRNELLSDSQTLIDADKAYLESGGSFKSVVVSLLTSDSFIYRK